MQTAICTFSDHAAAERARDRLLAAGFDRSDVHIEHTGRHMETSRDDDLRRHGGVEHEIALSEDVVERVTGFFSRMFGADHPHTGVYSSHVEGGRCVLLIDAHQTGDVERARTVLEGERAAHYDVVDRTGGQRMSDILRADPTDMEPASMQTSQRMPGHDGSWTHAGEVRREHAVATGDGDLDNVTLKSDRPAATQGEGMDPVGLRYADKGDADKPNVSRDGLGRTRNDD
jgi:hypothetical protein